MKIVNELTERELSELAIDIAKNNTLKISLMLRDKAIDSLPLRVAKLWLNASKVHYQFKFIDNYCTITIEHNMGRKYSYLLKEICRYI